MLSPFTVSFPGLNIPEIKINSTAFKIFNFPIQWYALIITCGIALAALYCWYRAKQEKIKTDDLLDIALYTIIFGIIGARAGYVLFSLENYIRDNPWETIVAMVNLREGGLQIYGGIIAGIATIVIICFIKKINPFKMLDAAGSAVIIGQFIGRWGNFMNGEAHGSLVEKGNPLYIFRMRLSRYKAEDGWVFRSGDVHPTFLYESLWNIVGFLLMLFLYKKKKFNGQIALMYLAWYGFGRMLIETLRTDSLVIEIGKADIRVSVVIGAVCFVAGVSMLIVNFILAAKTKKAGVEYVAFYEKPFLAAYAKREAKEVENAAAKAASDAVKNADECTENTDGEVNSEPAQNEEPHSDAEGEESDAPTDNECESKEDVTKRFNEIFNENKEENNDNDEGDKNGKDN